MSISRQYAVNLALKLQGIPYIWGGSEPRTGFDCSGFVIWILQVFGRLPAGDWTSDMLMKEFPETKDPKPGDLVFYGMNGEKKFSTHVMMYIGEMSGQLMCIGASGGDSKTLTVKDAEAKNAKVKIKPIHYRRDFIQFGDSHLP